MLPFWGSVPIFFNIKKKHYCISYCVITFFCYFFLILFVAIFGNTKTIIKVAIQNRKKKLCCQIFLQKTEMTAKCCDPLFLKKSWQNLFRKKKNGHSRMSKKKNLKILLSQFFAKTPKNPLFTLEFSEMLYFFYKNLYFRGVRFTKKFPLKSHFRGTPQYPPFYFLVIQKTRFKGGKI